MNKLKLNIDGFKCFKEDTSIEFNAITLLTGANSAGKSSVVQSLLLLKTLSEGNLSNSDSLIGTYVIFRGLADFAGLADLFPPLLPLSV